MSPTSPFLFALTLLLGLAHLCTASCDFQSFFEVDIDIDPRNSDFDFTPCDAELAKAKLKNLIDAVVTKRFAAYFEATAALESAEVENFCGGETSDGDDRLLRGRRDLVFSMSPNGWSYSSVTKCRFCVKDNSDGDPVWPVAVAQPDMVQMAFIDGQFVKLTSPPSSSPSMAPTSSTLAPTVPSPLQIQEAILKRKMQRQLTRVLTRKINHNTQRSCLAGSNSKVKVTLTPNGNQRPPIVCPVD